MARTIADLILAIYVDLANLELEAIRVAIQTLRSIVEDFTASAGAYALFVPMKIVDPFQWLGDPATYYIGNRDTKLSTPILTTYTPFSGASQPSGGTGGNYGFYATVAESLKDSDDPGRPDLDQDAYIAAVVFLFGSDTYMELFILLKKLMRLFDIPNVDLAPDVVPVPKNMRYTIVPQPMAKNAYSSDYWTGIGDLTTQPHAVKIEWDRDSKDWVNAAYGTSVYTEIENVILSRWKEGEFTASQVRATAGVVAGIDKWERAYDETAPIFIDTQIEPGNVYHYGLSYTYKVMSAEGVERYTIDPPEVDLVSIRVAIPKDMMVGPSRGTPPDWFSVDMIAMIPPLQKVLNYIFDWLDRMEASIYTGKDELEAFVDFLGKEIRRYHRWITEITNQIQQLIDALTLPDVYGGLLPIRGKGGTQFLLDQLGRGLFHDPNRPPFDKGTEAVAGLILMAGAETPGKLEKFWKTINLLFGSMMSSTENSLSTAIDQMNALSADLDRQICLTRGLTEEECAAADTNTTVGRDLEPSTESPDCAAAAEQAHDDFLKGNS